MDWATKRKTKYLSIVIGIPLCLILIFVYFKFFKKAPSCFDGVQNQDEKGIDCGGICTTLCSFESRDPIVIFERLYESSPGVYNVLALVENPNQGVVAHSIPYLFKLYDENNILLKEVQGTTFAPPGRVFPIFVSSIGTGNRKAVKEVLALGQNIHWQKESFNEPDLVVGGINSKIVDLRSRIEADITNNEVYPIRDLQVIVVVYDAQGNAHEASATVVDYISPRDTTHLSFAWPKAFDFTPSKIDIIPRAIPRDWIK